MFLYLYIYIYNCMFVSALPDPTCNSEKSANGGNKQNYYYYYYYYMYLNWIACVVISAISRLSRCFPKFQSHCWIHFSGLRIISLPLGVTYPNVPGNLFKDERRNYFFHHHSKLPLTLQFSNCCNGRQETVSMPQLSPPQSLPLGNSIQIKKSSKRWADSLSSVLSPQPPYNTKKPLWGREMPKYRCK